MAQIDFSKYKIQPTAPTTSSNTGPGPSTGTKIDFNKYKINKTPSIPVVPPQTVGNRFLRGAQDIATGVAQSELGAVQGAGQAVLKGTDALGITKNQGNDTFLPDPKALQGQNIPEKVGNALGTVAPYLTGAGEGDAAIQAPELATKVGGIAGKALGGIVKAAPGFIANTAIGTAQSAGDIGKGIESGVAAEAGQLGVKALPGVVKSGADALGRLALGKEGASVLSKLSDEEAQKFVNGKTLSETAHNTQVALMDFENKSRAKLQAVKQSIPDVKVGGDKISAKLNEGILSAVRSNAAYKGVSGDVEQAFKNPQELISSGLLNDDEAKKVQGIVNIVKNWKDTSARGVLNLKEQLDPFYTDGLNNSNKILRNVQSGLKDLVGDVAPKIKPALNEASDNIEKANDFRRQLGKDSVSSETKLGTIARGLKNPAANASKIKLLKDVEKATGRSLLPEIQGYSKYLDLIKNGADNIPTKLGTIAKHVGTRAGILGGLVVGGATAGEFGKKLLDGL